MNPDFPLAPWEVPPDCDVPLVAPADGSYRAFWQGEPTTFLFRHVETNRYNVTFVRASESQQVGNWISMTRGQIAMTPAGLRCYTEVPYAQTQAELSNSIARQFYFDGKNFGHSGLHHLTVSGDGACALSCDQWQYRFGLGFDISAWSAAQTGRYVKQLLLDSTDESRLSLNWLHSSRFERQEQFWRFARGDLKRMLRLFEACLQNEARLWKPEITALEWHAVKPESEEFDAYNSRQEDQLFCPAFQFRHESLAVTERLKRWKFLLWNHFEPTVRQFWLPVDDCNRSDEPPLRCVQVKVTPPSAHEQLEARLLLRDWFHQEYMPARFAELMEE